MGLFVGEMCIRETSSRLSVSEFFKVHEAWCEDEGRQLYQMKTVGDVMVEKGFERGPIGGRSHWKGLRWAQAAAEIVERATGSRPAYLAAPAPPDDGPVF
ncbi:MAG: hypothetical protein AAFP13_14990 [Pseudomonadota bacterium]